MGCNDVDEKTNLSVFLNEILFGMSDRIEKFGTGVQISPSPLCKSTTVYSCGFLLLLVLQTRRRTAITIFRCSVYSYSNIPSLLSLLHSLKGLKSIL